MVAYVFDTLRGNPELAIFLTLSVGYALGKVRLGSFELGSVTGVLLAGILIGQLDITIAPQIKSIFFVMFLFAVGYGVGPQFVRGIANDGIPQAVFAVVITSLCLLSVYAAVKMQGYDVGFAAGLLAGSQTISASIGLATDAINNLDLSVEQKKQMLDHIPVAYAVVYLWGTIGTGLILSVLGPKLLGVNLEEECKRYEKEMSGGHPPEKGQTAWRQVEMRAYELGTEWPVGQSVAEAEAGAHKEGRRAFTQAVRRGDEIIDFDGTATPPQLHKHSSHKC